ncbi:MAG: autotransporter-associated beta strand repeat-containing protein, partial [Akkermansia sp.]
MKLHLPFGLFASLMACYVSVNTTFASATSVSPSNENSALVFENVITQASKAKAAIAWPTENVKEVKDATLAGVRNGITNALTGTTINAKITTGFQWDLGQWGLTQNISENTYIELAATAKTNGDQGYTEIYNATNSTSGANPTGNLFFKVGTNGNITNPAGDGAYKGTLFGLNGTTLTGNLYMEFASDQLKIEGNSANLFGSVSASWSSTITGSSTLVFSKGTFGSASLTGDNSLKGMVIGGGMNTGEGIHGSTLVEVSGGTFFNGIAGSGNMNTATKKAGDSSTVNISGGTISGNIFGGSITNGSIGSATAANGTNVILSGGVINANIYAGNNNGGTIYGGTNVLLKNISDVSTVLTGGATQIIDGGNKSGGTIKGVKTLTFDKSSGTIAGKVQNFDKIILSAGSAITLTNTGSLNNKATISGAGTLSLTTAGTYNYALAHTGALGTINANTTGVVSNIGINESNVSLNTLALSTGSLTFKSHDTTTSVLNVAHLSSTGALAINLDLTLGLKVGTYQLITGDLSLVDSFVLGTASPDYSIANLNSYKTDGFLKLSVNKDVARQTQNLTWLGQSGTWTTTDWKYDTGTIKFVNGDNVTFDGNVAGAAATQDITLSGAITAGTMTINGATKTYNFIGNGALTVKSLEISGNQTINIKGGSSITTGKYQGSIEVRTYSAVNIGGDTAGKLVVTGSGLNDFVLSVAGWGNWDDNKSVMTILEKGEVIAENTALKLDVDGSTRLSIEGGTAKLLGIHLGDQSNKTSEVRLTNKGVLNIGSLGISNFNANNNDTINLGDGTVGAWGSWSTNANISLGYAAADGEVTTRFNTAMGATGGNYTITLSGVLKDNSATKKGGILKEGAGTLILTGVNTYTGKTTVKEGTLQLGSAATYTMAGNLDVNTGASLNVGGQGKKTGDTISGITNLTISGNMTLATGSHLIMDIGADQAHSDTITYSGAATNLDGVNFDLNLAQATASGTYDLITSTNALTLANSILNLNRGASASLTLSGNKVVLTVTDKGKIGDLTWAGTGESAIWTTQSGGDIWTMGAGTTKFMTGDNVTFGSTGTKAISIAGQVTPGTIDITGNGYVFSGSGSIAGAGAMHINIGGEEANKTVTFNTNNAGYSGAITLTSGNLVLGSAGATGTGGIIFDGGTVYIGANNAIGANTITASAGKIVTLGVAGSGSYTLATTNFSGLSVSKIDTGTLTLGTAMTSGTLKVMGGELITNIVDASGSVNYTIGANAKLTLHGRINSSTPAVRSGSVTIAGGTLNLADNLDNNYFGGSGVTFQDQAGHIIGSNADSAQWRIEGGSNLGSPFKFTVTAAASGSTISGPRMTFTRGDNPIVFAIANGAQEFDLTVSSKMDCHIGNETLKKEGAGTLLLTGEAGSQSPIKLDITAGTVQIGDATHGTTTGTWTGAISIGTGTNLNIDKTTTSSMGLLTGSGTLNIMNKGDVSLATTNVGHTFSGTINLKGGGILNLNNNILGAGGKIVINQGGLSNASHYAGTISIDQTVAGAIAQTISLGGLAGNKITSFQGTSIASGADQVTKLTDIGDGNISLKPNTEGKLFLGISSDMIGTAATPGTGAIFTFTTPGTNQVIIADNTVLTLSLTDQSSSTLMNNIGKDQLIHLTNGTLTLGTGSSIAFDSPYNAFNEFFTLNGTEGGSIKVDAIDQNIPGQPNPTHGWIIVSQNSHGLTINSTNFASVQKAIGVYNDHTITLDATAGDITLNNLEGASNTAMINTAAGTTLTLMSTDKVTNHQQIYNGGISGNAHIVKSGGDDTYKLTIGGNVSGASLTINDGNLTLNGKTNAIQGDLTLSHTGSLTLGTGSTLTSGGTLITQDNATITLGQGSNLTLNSLANLTADITGTGTLAVNTGAIALGQTGSLGNELTLKLGQSASIHFDQNQTLGAIAGNGTITIDQNQTLTLGNSTGTFSGTLLGNGSISHTGTGTQTLDTLGNAGMSITQQGTGTTILQNTGNQGQPITYKDIQVLEGALQIANNTTVTDINIAKGAHVILGRDKDAEGVYQHSAILTSTNSTLTG